MRAALGSSTGATFADVDALQHAGGKGYSSRICVCVCRIFACGARSFAAEFPGGRQAGNGARRRLPLCALQRRRHRSSAACVPTCPPPCAPCALQCLFGPACIHLKSWPTQRGLLKDRPGARPTLPDLVPRGGRPSRLGPTLFLPPMHLQPQPRRPQLCQELRSVGLGAAEYSAASVAAATPLQLHRSSAGRSARRAAKPRRERPQNTASRSRRDRLTGPSCSSRVW
jgi:hypothetical protein